MKALTGEIETYFKSVMTKLLSVGWQSLWASCAQMRTAVSHDDTLSLFVHQSSKPDVLPSPARTPSVPRISRLCSWGSLLGKETCHHFEDSEGLWSFKTWLRKEEFFEGQACTQWLKISCGMQWEMQWFHPVASWKKRIKSCNSSVMCLKIWEEFGAWG